MPRRKKPASHEPEHYAPMPTGQRPPALAVGAAELEALQRTLLESLPGGVAVVDCESREIEYLNPEAAAMLGIEPGAMAGRDCHFCYCPTEQSRCPILDLGQKLERSRRELVRPDGRPLPVLITARRISLGGRDKLLELFVDLSAQLQAEQESRKVEERHRITLMSIGDGVLATDAAGRVELLNPVAEALTGWSGEEARGKPVEEVFPIFNEETRRPVENPVRRVVREGVVVGLANHTVLVARDGVERPIADSGAPVREAGGQVVGTVLVFRDQTEERARQNALKQSEQRYRSLFESTNDGVCLHQLIYGPDGSPADYRILDVNPRFESITGIGRDRSVGKLATELYETTQPPYLEVYAEVAQTGHSALFETYFPPMDKHFLISVFSPGPGQFATVFQDITEHIRAEQALRESEARLASIFAAAPVGIGLVQDQVLLMVNDTLCRMLGRAREELIGRSMLLLYSSQEESERVEIVKSAQIARHGRSSIETEMACKDGTVLDVILSSTPVDRDHPARGVTFTVLDITGRRKMEEQLLQAQKLESVGLLAAGVAHDLNNLLTPIMGHSEMLLYFQELEEPVRESIGEIASASQRARDLVRQLMAFGRKQTLEVKPLDLNLVVTEFAGLLRSTLRENVEIRLALAPRLRYVLADRSQLEQVLMNLAVNAQDAMPEGGTLGIETAEVLLDQQAADRNKALSPGHYVRLTLSDTGLGMDQPTMERVFEPFFTTKELGKGTGLGLSTVYGIVTQHNGQIEVSSEPGGGATFNVYLPVMNEQAALRVEQPEVQPRQLRGSESIVIAEDEPQVRQTILRILSGLGYRVVAAQSPSECLRLFRQAEGPVRLLLADVVMPEMSGKELYEQLRQLSPELRVLYLSGYPDNVIVHHGILDEGTPFLQKPFSPQDLARKVRQVLES